MVEAGADQVPEATLLEALDLAQREIVKICEAQEELAAKAGKPKWLDAGVTEELDGKYGDEIAAAHRPSTACTTAGAIVDEILETRGRRADDESTEDDVVRELQARMSLAAVLEKKRSAAAEAPVREQFEADLRALTEAEQDSKELKSAKQHLLYDRIVDTVQLPFPAAAEGGEAVSRTR